MELKEGDIVEIQPIRYIYQRDSLRNSSPSYTEYKIYVNKLHIIDIERFNYLKGVQINNINNIIKTIRDKYSFNGEVIKKKAYNVSLGFGASRY